MAGVSQPAAGGGRRIVVPAERLDGWLIGFAERHGGTDWVADPRQVVVTAADGARAECEVPFPPLDVDHDMPFGGLIAHACAERTVGVLLVRLGGYAAGVFTGPRLIAAKVGSRHVHGRAAPGGWSQKRFARRREGEAQAALQAAADAAARLLIPAVGELQAVVGGGDRRALTAVLGDPRLAALRPLVTGRVLSVPDPRLRVLQGSHQLFRTVSVRVLDPE
jgi:hypothetical protein